MTAILPPDARGLAEAARLLRAGALVAIPTETVYGLAADATSDAAVAAIYAAKGRPTFNPLIIHVADHAAAERLGRFDPLSRQLAASFWPGPLTLILPRAADCPVSLLASAGLDTLALRVPAHDLTRDLIAAAERPLAAPSANPSGRVSPTTADHVLSGLQGRIAAVLDGGACPIGVESTIVQVLDGRAHVLRPGGLDRAALEAAAGPVVTTAAMVDARSGGAPVSPGQLASHYAPRARLRLNARSVAPDEALLAFGPEPLSGARATINLSPAGDTTEAASRLFAALRALDRPDIAGIAVMPIPDMGLGEAVNDRLTRAAAPRG